MSPENYLHTYELNMQANTVGFNIQVQAYSKQEALDKIKDYMDDATGKTVNDSPIVVMFRSNNITKNMIKMID